MVKNPLVQEMQETWVQSLSLEDPLGENMEICSIIIAWKIPWIEGPGGHSQWGCREPDMTERLTLTAMKDIPAGL